MSLVSYFNVPDAWAWHLTDLIYFMMWFSFHDFFMLSIEGHGNRQHVMSFMSPGDNVTWLAERAM